MRLLHKPQRPFTCIGRVSAGIGVFISIAALPIPAQSVGRAVGDWTFQMEGDRQPQRVTLTADGDSLRGAVYGQKLAGTLRADRLVFAVGEYRWRAALRGDSVMTGWLGIGADSSRWSATRFRPPATPRTFMYAPTVYQRSLTTGVPRALTLYPGDTVHTSTLDAGGWGTGAFGARGNKISMGGNPLTGPFYVEGAVPGDVLVVRLHRVRLNRGWAFSGTSLMDNAIEASYAAERKSSQFDNKWTLDTLAGVARLTSPPAALAGLTIPLRPFLGVIAVAPGDGVVPSTRESGQFGGNMEYNQLREGTTLYLPVTELGAYLYLGDGHAAQGDGELTGDAMETSMDVTFSVDIQRWKFASVPRAESAEHLMSMGIAGSLDDAFRRATTDMARWLESDYKLTASEAAVIMGFGIIYDIPDIVPGQFGVSARLPKSLLSTVPRR
jgi:amidase